MKRYLILKLLAIHLIVICFAMVIVWFSIDTLAAGYFVTLMEKYNISPKPAHAMFVSAIHRYLLWAFAGAVALAVLLSFLMMRRVLAPLSRMTVISREIAEGNFGTRVPVGSRDEVGQLAQAFNQMAASLEAIERLRRTLMIDVAHELRTPLTNIRGYLEALDDRVLPFSKETFILAADGNPATGRAGGRRAAAGPGRCCPRPARSGADGPDRHHPDRPGALCPHHGGEVRHR